MVDRARRRLLSGAGAAFTLAGLPAAAEQRVKSGTVYIEQLQVAFIGSGGAGEGTLKARREGLAVSLGADAMVIEFK